MQGNMKSIAKVGLVYLDDTNVKYMQGYDGRGSWGSWLLEVPQCTETWDACLLAPLHHLGVADVI